MDVGGSSPPTHNHAYTHALTHSCTHTLSDFSLILPSYPASHCPTYCGTAHQTNHTDSRVFTPGHSGKTKWKTTRDEHTHTHTHSGQAYSQSDHADDGPAVWSDVIERFSTGWSSDVITWHKSIPGHSHVYSLLSYLWDLHWEHSSLRPLLCVFCVMNCKHWERVLICSFMWRFIVLDPAAGWPGLA